MEKLKAFAKDNWIVIVAIIYLLVPIDLIPDFIPVFGKLDDSSILILDLVKRYLDSRKATNEKN